MGYFSQLFDVSLATANRLYIGGWYLAFIASIITACGLGMQWIGTRVRDRDFDENIAKLHENAALSEERSKLLEKGNLELATILERERAARARIEAGLASRHVRPEQRATLIEMLRGLTLTVVLSRHNDLETTEYAREVASALNDAGINIQEGSLIVSDPSSLAGLLVEEAADPRLINALFMAGLATQKMESAKNDMLLTGDGKNAILVARKRSPF